MLSDDYSSELYFIWHLGMRRLLTYIILRPCPFDVKVAAIMARMGGSPPDPNLRLVSSVALATTQRLPISSRAGLA